MKIHSKNRNYLKTGFVLLLTVLFLILWFTKNQTFYIVFSGVLGFILLIEILSYSQSFIDLNDERIIIRHTAFFNLIKEDYHIELKNIQSSYFKNKKYDSWELYQRFFWEILFPSGQSYLVINTEDGKKIKIPFSGNKNEILKLQQKLPDRTPN